VLALGGGAQATLATVDEAHALAVPAAPTTSSSSSSAPPASPPRWRLWPRRVASSSSAWAAAPGWRSTSWRWWAVVSASSPRPCARAAATRRPGSSPPAERRDLGAVPTSGLP